MKDLTPRPRHHGQHAIWGLAAALAVIVAVATSPGTCTPPKPESEIRRSDYGSTYKARVTMSSKGSECSAVLVLGVGTAAWTEDYDRLAQAIVAKGEDQGGYVVVVVDFMPNNPFKRDSDKYTGAVRWIKRELKTWVPGCEPKYWIVGGHSAGGTAAYKSLAKNPSLADGMFGLDPFDRPDVGASNFSAVYWGFDKPTCLTSVGKTAMTFYCRSSKENRVLYVVNGPRSCRDVSGCRYGHCSFVSGGGCKFQLFSSFIRPPIPFFKCKTKPHCSFFSELAMSFDTFIESLRQGKRLTVRKFNETLVDTYSGEDLPPKCKT